MNRSFHAFALLGTGKTYNNQNSLLVTKDELVFFVAPTPGAGQWVDNSQTQDGSFDFNFDTQNFLFNRQQIVAAGEQYLATTPVETVAQTETSIVFPLDQISTVTLQ